MKLRTIVLLMECVNNGLEYGLNRAHKHTDTPNRETIINECSQAIEANLHNYFDFATESDGESV